MLLGKFWGPKIAKESVGPVETLFLFCTVPRIFDLFWKGAINSLAASEYIWIRKNYDFFILVSSNETTLERADF